MWLWLWQGARHVPATRATCNLVRLGGNALLKLHGRLCAVYCCPIRRNKSACTLTIATPPAATVLQGEVSRDGLGSGPCSAGKRLLLFPLLGCVAVSVKLTLRCCLCQVGLVTAHTFRPLCLQLLPLQASSLLSPRQPPLLLLRARWVAGMRAPSLAVCPPAPHASAS